MAVPAASPKPTPSDRPKIPVLTHNRLFVLLVLIVTAAFFSALIGLGVLALFSRDPPTVLQSRFAEACDFIIKVGLGALAGLLGGRAATPDRLELADKP